MKYTVEDVRSYWDSHLNLTQFLTAEGIAIGSEQFWTLLEQSLERYDYKASLFLNFAKGALGARLLEVGCGLGLELAKLGRLGFHVTGAELAPNAVRLCNDYLKKRQIVGEAVVQNAEAMDFADATFDAVYSSGVLQHTPDISKAIAEIWRVLKPGGKILIILYHRRSWFYFLHRLSGVSIEFQADEAPIINAYTKRELRQLFAKFRDVHVDCEYYYPKPSKRKGLAASLFNRMLVPLVRLLPRFLVKNYGWHLVLTGTK